MRHRILIDAHMLGENEGGNERYTSNLIRSLAKITDIGVIVYNSISPSKQCSLFPKSDIFRLFFLPFFMIYKKYTLLHSNYILPFFKLPNVKYVVTVHDTSFKRFPHLFTLKDRFIFSLLFPHSLSLADAIIVPSSFIKNELSLLFPHHSCKIIVTHEGVDPVFQLKPHKKSEKKYFLCISSRSERKNIQTIIQAFIQARLPHTKLLIVGHLPPLLSSKLHPSIKYLGYINDKTLRNLYTNALALIYYSSYEGFGLPIIEALSLNTPVIASDIPSNREIGKSLPYFVPPNNTRKLTEAIKRAVLIKNKAKTRSKILALYNWSVTARTTLNLYKSL